MCESERGERERRPAWLLTGAARVGLGEGEESERGGRGRVKGV